MKPRPHPAVAAGAAPGIKFEKVLVTGLVAAAAFLAACAAAPPPKLPPIEPSYSALDRADAVVYETWRRFLPEPASWPPRVRLHSGEEEGVEYLQALPVSSLCYFPRFVPRLERALAEAGLAVSSSSITSRPGGAAFQLILETGKGPGYRFEFEQKVRGRLALIIDDVGYTRSGEELLLSLDYPLTLAILPRLPHSLTWSRIARESGYETILHFPLEAINPDADIGPGGLRRSASPAEVREAFDRNLETVRGAVGVNNHMGSAFTSDAGAMALFLEEVRRRGLFFVDSLTVGTTATRELAPGLGLPFAVRDVFLDHENREEPIVRQFLRARDLALRGEEAVAIGHYRRLTLELLARLIPELEADDIQIVPVSELVR